MISPRNILWIDGLGGLIAGMVMLPLSHWLSQWYRLPPKMLMLMGTANLAYGCYSLTLAARAKRPKFLILLLVAANLTWTVLCFRWAIIHAGSASWFGLAHLNS